MELIEKKSLASKVIETRLARLIEMKAPMKLRSCVKYNLF